MNSIIKETEYYRGNKTYVIKVFYNGSDYTACGYLNGDLINETRLSRNVTSGLLNSDSPEIENLVYLLKEDINDGVNEIKKF